MDMDNAYLCLQMLGKDNNLSLEIVFKNNFNEYSQPLSWPCFIFGLHLFYKVVGSQVEMVSRAIESRLQLTSILRA